MRSDPCVLQVYDEFAGSGLELLREAVHRKNVLLCGMSLIDRAETFGEIREIYDGLYPVVHRAWARLYDDEDEFDGTVGAYRILLDRGTCFAKTRIQRLAEQFFFTLEQQVLSTLVMCRGRMRIREADRIDEEAREYEKALAGRIALERQFLC